MCPEGTLAIPNGARADRRCRFAGARARAARAASDKTSAKSPGADHLTRLAFLDRMNRIFRIQFAPPVRVSNFVNSVSNSFGRPTFEFYILLLLVL